MWSDFNFSYWQNGNTRAHMWHIKSQRNFIDSERYKFMTFFRFRVKCNCVCVCVSQGVMCIVVMSFLTRNVFLWWIMLRFIGNNIHSLRCQCESIFNSIFFVKCRRIKSASGCLCLIAKMMHSKKNVVAFAFKWL